MNREKKQFSKVPIIKHRIRKHTLRSSWYSITQARYFSVLFSNKMLFIADNSNFPVVKALFIVHYMCQRIQWQMNLYIILN